MSVRGDYIVKYNLSMRGRLPKRGLESADLLRDEIITGHQITRRILSFSISTPKVSTVPSEVGRDFVEEHLHTYEPVLGNGAFGHKGV